MTNDSDRSLFMKFRRELGCSPRDCNVFQVTAGSRYNVPPPPCEGVETVASVLHIENDLVFNCLVDQSRIDQRALTSSREESEKHLLMKRSDGKEEIRGRTIKEVYFLPNGDFWQVKRGYRSMISNDRQLKQTIGIDRTAAIEEAEREAEQLNQELREQREKEASTLKEHKEHKVRWNKENRAMRQTSKEIENIMNAVDDIKAEADNAENVTIDTTELEEDVKVAEESLESLKEKESDIRKAMEELKPAINDKEKQLEETYIRNEKIIADLESVNEKLEEFVKSQAKRQEKEDKQKAKVAQVEEYVVKQKDEVVNVTETMDNATMKARLMTFKRHQQKNRRNEGSNDRSLVEPQLDDLEAIEPLETDRNPTQLKAKIERSLKQIEKEKERRQLRETDPEVALEKYQRSKKDLDAKVDQVETIEKNVCALAEDIRSRRKRWIEFRGHIVTLTNNSFDEMLNKKGSSGSLEFDHEVGTLDLVVQKDNANEMSQTNDVKALSGGERSFTTLALLLALGENLETPFRVMGKYLDYLCSYGAIPQVILSLFPDQLMPTPNTHTSTCAIEDEFDVFLDPVARKIALDNLVSAAKGLEHRQFIFITPQDLSNLKTDPMLKIIRMKPPARSNTPQQTLPFQSP